MSPLRFRLSGLTRSLSDWLALILPQVDRATRRHWVELGLIEIENEIVDRLGFVCPAGGRVVIGPVAEDVLSSLKFAVAGFSSDVSGEWFAWVDEPAWWGGRLGADVDGDLCFHVEERARGLARLVIQGRDCAANQVCEALAERGMPVVGDLFGGGLAVVGGPVIAATRAGLASLPAVLDSVGPAWPEAASDAAPPVLVVSREAGRALERGHPWVLPDEASESAERFHPGTELRIDDREGRRLGWAWAEGDARLAARMAAFGPVEQSAIASIESRVARALGLRRALIVPKASGPRTDCFRLIHGEADGLPGFFVDRLGPLLRVLLTGRASDGFRARAIDALRSQMPVTPEGVEWSLIELLHLRAPGHREDFDRVRWLEGSPETLVAAGVDPIAAGFWVEENGLRFSVDPGWDSARRTRPGFGLFPDQRENRQRLGPLASRGGRWLNLFAHTGAFSVALLAAGADHVVSVDLSGPYLSRLEANLEANRERGVDPARHESIRGEGRHVVESLDPRQRFAGIVLDPPTSASAGRRFWSVRQDLEPLLRACVDRLEEGGTLLVTQNAKGASLGLDEVLERIASRAGRIVRELSPAGPSMDFPSLAGFPEGTAFEGWLLQVE